MSLGKAKLIVLGGVNEDIVVRVRSLPRPGETIHASGIDRSPGGKGLNQAIAAARFGARVTLLGAVGDDAAGASLLAWMNEVGLDAGGVEVCTGTPTGQALICLAENGDNSIVVAAGANAAYGEGRVKTTPLPSCAVVLAQFEAPLDAIEALLTRGRERPLRILNAAPALPHGRPLFELADILILNETELQTFAGSTAPLIDDGAIAAAARQLIGRPDQRVIVTLGANGCRSVDLTSVEAIPAFRATVIDTVGAGDCFCGVFAGALAGGMMVSDALRQAAAAAALSVGRRGAATAMPYRREVEAFLHEVARADATLP